MTKLKNTKKGMAKKALSISLVAAMLATSNVPVWAAEFSDGTGVEAFSAEAPVTEETPSIETTTFSDVEQAEDVAVVNADPTLDSRYTVEYVGVPSSLEWNKPATVKIRIYDNVIEKYVTNNAGFKVRYLDNDGQLAVNEGGGDITLPTPDAEGYSSLLVNFRDWISNVSAGEEIIGQAFRLQVYNTKDGEAVGYAQASSSITVEKATIKGKVNLLGGNNTSWNNVTYTGKDIVEGPTLKNNDEIWDVSNNGIQYTGATELSVDGLGLSGSLSKECKIQGEDIVNAWNYSHKSLTSTVNIEDPLYRGEVVITFAIEPKVLTDANFEENIQITLPDDTYQYTGTRIEVPVEKATVTDLNSGKTIADALKNTASSTIWISDASGSVKVYNDDDKDSGTFVKAWVNASALKNYTVSTNNLLRRLSGTYKVVERDLADTANTQITIKAVNNEVLVNGPQIDADALKNSNLVIKDVKSGKDITSTLLSQVNVVLASNPLPVETGKTYTATVEPKNTKNVINKREVTFKVVAHDLSTAQVEKESVLGDDAKYTGSQITKNLTKDNFVEKFGTVKYFYNGSAQILAKDQEYSSTPEFGENLNAYDTAANTNVGKGQIIINGLGTFEGTQKVISFNILPREADKLNVPASVEYNEAYDSFEDYDMASKVSVTASFKDEWTGEKKTLTVPTTDYTVTYSWLDADGTTVVNKPVKGGYIQTTVAKNTKVLSNFDVNALTVKTAKTKLAKKAIVAENVILNKDSYVYTGKEADLDYKVVYNGETLEKGVDYKANIVNGVNVGEGTLIITGKGDFDETPISIKFQITPAKAADVKVITNETYDGTQHKPATPQLLLNGVDVTNQFKVSYPSSKTANINAGNGQITLTPVKNNKNFDGAVDTTFTIKPFDFKNNNKGNVKAYNEKESLVSWYTEGETLPASEFIFKYDGTKKSYTKTVYEAPKFGTGDKKVVTADDYEILYLDAVSGKAGEKYGRGHVIVIAKGNYINSDATATYTAADGTVYKNVILDKTFLIERLPIHKSNIAVANGSYSGGFNVDPVVTINYNGKNLIKGVDFKLDYTGFTQNRTEVTNGKTLKVKVLANGGYYLESDAKNVTYQWGIDKFDLANADILVSGTDVAPVVKVMNGSVAVPEADMDLVVADGKVTVTAKATSKNYTGTQTVDISHELEKPETPMISRVDVVGNKATVILSGNVEGATGYDYVISKDRDCITNKDYDKVNKNILTTQTTFTYTQQNTYYAYCHAWKRGEDGKKIFSAWSNGYPFSVTAITPDQPAVVSAKVSGSTVTVTYTQAANATGYDTVLGTALKKVDGEMRPVEYGTLVKKVKNGNTTTVTFKNVPKGTYYVGLHAWNRTSEDGKKVFSPWSNNKKITVK